jgi:hypothetical protein
MCPSRFVAFVLAALIPLLLSASTATSAARQAPSATGVVVTATPVTLFPDSKRVPLTTLPPGTRVEVIEVQTEWLRIAFRDGAGQRYGFVPGSNVRVGPSAGPTDAGSAPDTADARAVSSAASPAERTTTSGAAPSDPPTGLVRTEAVSEQSIEAAIACGQRRIKCEAPVLNLSGGLINRLFSITLVAGPLGRIYAEARDAKEELRRFTRADVTADMLKGTIDVSAIYTDRDMTTNIDVKHIVVMAGTRGDGEAIQPRSISTMTDTVSNLMGARIDRIGKNATFALEDLPPADFRVVVVTSGKRLEANVSNDNRRRLAAWMSGHMPSR